MIKACVMTSAHPALDPRIFHKECRTLVREGYQVTLIAPGTEKRTQEGVILEPVPQWTNRFVRMIASPLAVYRKARRQRADIYHIHDPELIPIALLLRAEGKRVIYDIHEDLPRTISYKTYIPRWLRRTVARLVEAMEHAAAQWFSALVTATPFIAKRFAAKNEDVVVVHNYPRIEEIQADDVDWPPDDPPGNVALLYVGMRITRARGAEEMVRAMGLLPPDVPFRLKFVGRWDPPGLFESLSRIPGWERTENLGFQGRSELASLLRRSRAGLVLIHNEPNYATALPVKLFEYMCAGLPVIASDLRGCREIVQSARCGLLANPLSPEEIAQAISYLWTHPAEADAMGRRGFDAVRQRYNWASQEKILLQLYRRLSDSALPGTPRLRFVP